MKSLLVVNLYIVILYFQHLVLKELIDTIQLMNIEKHTDILKNMMMENPWIHTKIDAFKNFKKWSKNATKMQS